MWCILKLFRHACFGVMVSLCVFVGAVSCAPEALEDEDALELVEEIYDLDRFDIELDEPVPELPVKPYPESEEGRTVIIWMSIDGMRHDYLARTETPHFDRLIREGAHTRELKPGFPSITFPSHTSQATGVRVADHGIPANTFYDRERDRIFTFSGKPDLLEAEPIWTTATRQGLRVAVYDWIKSYNQPTPHAAEYYGQRYSGDLTDRERMELILDTWRADDSDTPLQLIMGYTVTPDLLGHEVGPEAPEIADMVAEMDALYGWFTEQIITLFDAKMSPRDELYLFITTDHGMSTVHSLVNIHLIAGLEEEEEKVLALTNGNMANIYLNKIESAEVRMQVEQNILNRLQAYDFLYADRRKDLPEQWGYNHPNRVGDIVVALDPGYTFHRGIASKVEPVEHMGGPMGMHGYDHHVDSNMLGVAVFWRYPEPLGGTYLGPVDSLQLHPTICRILGIQPAKGATHEYIDLPPPRMLEPILQDLP